MWLMCKRDMYEEVKVVLEEFQTFTWIHFWITPQGHKHERKCISYEHAKISYDSLEQDEWVYRSILRIIRK